MMLPTAAQLTSDLRHGRLSSETLVGECLGRIRRYNPLLNAVIALDEEGALARAREADRRLRAGGPVGPLHGLPMTIKDVLEVAGFAAVNGAPAQRDYRPAANAVVVQRLIDAGVIVLGKTNVPLYSLDLQTFNEVFGVTRNPWHPERSPGGSSGGAAVALATGMTPAEVGTDLAGSLRLPAHACGVCSLKPTYGVVPVAGVLSVPPGQLRVHDLSVVGPMARAVTDLRLLFDVMAGGPDLPRPARPATAMRAGVWLDETLCPVDAGVATVLDQVVRALGSAGVALDAAGRPAFEPGEYFRNFLWLMYGEMSASFAEPVYRSFALAARRGVPGDDWTPLTLMPAAVTQSHREWLAAAERREWHRRAWAEFFAVHDVLITPVAPTPALPHDHRPFEERTIRLGGRDFAYMQQSFWCGLATAGYLPAAVVPAGLDSAGLPVGLQIIGPYRGDYTVLAFAELVEDLTGGFRPPPGLA